MFKLSKKIILFGFGFFVFIAFGVVNGDANCQGTVVLNKCCTCAGDYEYKGGSCVIKPPYQENGFSSAPTPACIDLPTQPTVQIPDCGGGSPLDSSAQGGNCQTLKTTKSIGGTSKECGFQYCGPSECSEKYRTRGIDTYSLGHSADSQYKTDYIKCIAESSCKEPNKIYGKNDESCCIGGQTYDEAIIGTKMTKCCIGTLYNNGKECCEGGIVAPTADGYSCTKCGPNQIVKENQCVGDASSWDFSCDSKLGYKLTNNKCCRCSYMTDEYFTFVGSLTQDKQKAKDDITNKCMTDSKPSCIDPTCKDGATFSNGACLTNQYGNMGIDCSETMLRRGQCKLNIYKSLGIRKGNETMEAKTFLQDIVNGATMFIGTIVTVMILYCGVMMVVSSYSGANPDKYKKGVVSGLIGLVIVTSSYVIIRLVQYLAKGG